jgi:hypothetical protein
VDDFSKGAITYAYDMIEILRLSPNEGCLEMEINREIVEVTVFLRETEGTFRSVEHQTIRPGVLKISDFKELTDYQIYVEENGSGEGSCRRLFRCGKTPGQVINYIHPQDRTYYPSGDSPASPSIVRCPDGRLIVSHDIYAGGCAQNLSKVFVSDDNGCSWNYLSEIYPCFWGKLFIHRDVLYMFGSNHEYGDLHLFKSDDYGRSWHKPEIVLRGGNGFTGGPHKAPMPVIEHKGRLWTAIDYGSWATGEHRSGVISVRSDSDISDPKNWIPSSSFLPYDERWEGTADGETIGLLEGNIVVKPDGRLVNFLRYQTNLCKPNFGKAIYLYVDDKDPAAELQFGKVVDFPGNLSKFSIYYDEKTEKYWSLVSRGDEINPGRRNELVLLSSVDLEDWKVERVVLDYENNDWYEERDKVGFQYVDFIFDDKDILFVSRTGINGARNFHDANHITFHRVENYAESITNQ